MLFDVYHFSNFLHRDMNSESLSNYPVHHLSKHGRAIRAWPVWFVQFCQFLPGTEYGRHSVSTVRIHSILSIQWLLVCVTTIFCLVVKLIKQKLKPLFTFKVYTTLQWNVAMKVRLRLWNTIACLFRVRNLSNRNR